jgi:alpha-L-fucosidase
MKRHARRWLGVIVGVAGVAVAAAAEPEKDDGGHAPAEAVARWRDLRFGLFIHWGPVSLTGHEIGWSRGAPTPIAEYDQLYTRFNPTEFDADAWARIAVAAGMKYVILTTKHHDGFCLWDTKETEYNIMRSPFGRDVVAELAKACREHGLAFGVYYSTCDWHHPAFPNGGTHGSQRKPTADLAAYDAYLRAQTTELVQKYGPLLTVWFDVPQAYDATYGVPMMRALRALQPDLLINNRAYSVGGHGSGIGHQIAIGDYDTPEQSIGGYQTDRAWETCMTLCRQWAWKPNDTMKSVEECLRVLIHTIGGDGNLLFNVGPMPDGRVEPRQVARLEEMGAWVKAHGEAIHGTRGGPLPPGGGLAMTRRGGNVYLFIFPEAGADLRLPKFPRPVRAARVLGGEKVAFTETGRRVTLDLPPARRVTPVTVVQLEFGGDTMEFPRLDLPGDLCRPTASNVYQNNVGTYGPARAIDGNAGTRWATDEGVTEAVFEAELIEPGSVGGVAFDEEFAPRVQEFEVDLRVGGAWTTIHRGTTIGRGFRATFEPVKADALRLRILRSSDGPTFSRIGVIFAP